MGQFMGDDRLQLLTTHPIATGPKCEFVP
jgi:hypothetical protein